VRRGVREALDILSERGTPATTCAYRLPFGADVETFLNAHDVNYIVEQNRDHQLKSLIALERTSPRKSSSRCSITAAFP